MVFRTMMLMMMFVAYLVSFAFKPKVNICIKLIQP